MSTVFRNVHAGQRVITSAGVTRIVAFVDPAGHAYVYGPAGLERAHVVCDAWGGEPSLDPLMNGLPVARPRPASRRPTNTAFVPLAA
jgi:hypothetical protein